MMNVTHDAPSPTEHYAVLNELPAPVPVQPADQGDASEAEQLAVKQRELSAHVTELLSTAKTIIEIHAFLAELPKDQLHPDDWSALQTKAREINGQWEIKVARQPDLLAEARADLISIERDSLLESSELESAVKRLNAAPDKAAPTTL